MSLQNSENLKTPTKDPRPILDQIVSLLIFLILGLLSWSSIYVLDSSMFSSLIFAKSTHLLYFFLSTALWQIWRANSIRTLKIEVVLYFLTNLFSLAWHTTFLMMRQSLISLVFIFLLLAVSLITCFVFWKKDRFAGFLVVPFIFWVLYAITLNLFITLNP